MRPVFIEKIRRKNVSILELHNETYWDNGIQKVQYCQLVAQNFTRFCNSDTSKPSNTGVRLDYLHIVLCPSSHEK